MRRYLVLCLLFGLGLVRDVPAADLVLDVPANPPPRIAYGLDLLERGLVALGHHVTRAASAERDGLKIVIGTAEASHLEGLLPAQSEIGPEGFRLQGNGDQVLAIAGGDASGVLYGCMDVLDLAATGGMLNGKRFATMSVTRNPALQVRGYAVPLPALSERAGWFADRGFWTSYLDDLASRRFNTVFLWWPALPEAAQLGDSYRWLSTEADRRGLAIANVAPVTSADPRARIERLVADAPGSMLALRGTTAVMKDTVIPALKHAGKQTPLIWCDADVREAPALAASYEPFLAMGNLTGEVLASTDFIDPAVRAAAESVAEIAVVRTHNLAPFRWFAPTFVQACVRSVVNAHLHGLQVFPLDPEQFPFSADKTTPRTSASERDWLWREAWGRYAWNPEREAVEDGGHWERLVSNWFGTSRKVARQVLDAMEAAGQILPRITCSFSLGTDATVDVALGATLEQFMHHTQRWFNHRAGVTFDEELELAQKGASAPAGKDHMLAAAGEILNAATKATETLPKAARHVTRNVAEFERWSADIDCAAKLANFYADKVRSAYHARLYRVDRDASHFPHLEGFLSRSCDWFKTHCSLHAYYYEQTSRPERRKPLPTSAAATMKDVLRAYQQELEVVKANIALLKNADADPYLRELAVQAIYASADSLMADVPDAATSQPWLLVDVAAADGTASGDVVAAIEVDDGRVVSVLELPLKGLAWHPCCIALNRWAGKSVKLRLVARPSGTGAASAVVFAHARIVTGRLPAKVAPSVLPAQARVEVVLVDQMAAARWSEADGRAMAGAWGGTDSRPGILVAPVEARRMPFAVELDVAVPAPQSAAGGDAH